MHAETKSWTSSYAHQSANIYTLELDHRLTMTSWHDDFRVADWLVSPKLSRISKDDQVVTVKQKSMAVLTCLADANGEVVSRNEIMDSVWPGMAVTDDVLTQSIVELRKAFDDDAKSPQVIETIPRVGFRMLTMVSPATTASRAKSAANLDTKPVPPDTRERPSPSAASRNLLLTAGAMLFAGAVVWALFEWREIGRDPVITIEEQPSIAVLPFVNMSDDPDNEHFSDGLSEEIIILLTGIPNLKVIGRTSSFAFKGKNEDLRVIGTTLGVQTILEGSVRKSGDRLRITAQLVKVEDGAHIWAQTYDRTMRDIFAVQDNVAAAVIDALQIHVGTVPSRGRPTESAEAYALFLKARAAVNAFESQAIALFQKAIELDPNFAEAYEMLGYAYWTLAGSEYGAIEAQRLVSKAATNALAINPDLVLAQALQRAADFGPDIRWRKIEAFERASQKQPDNPMILETFLYSLTENGYLEEALGVAERYLELDPLSLIANVYWSAALYAVGRTDEAIAALEFTDRMDMEIMEGINLVEGRDEIAIGRFEAYLRQHDVVSSPFRELVTSARDPVSGQAYLDRRIPQIVASMAEIDDLNWEQGLTSFYLFFGFLDRHFELVLATEPSDSTWHVGGIHVWRGNVFRHLGFTGHPRYLELVSSLGIDETWEQRGPPDFCEKIQGQWVCE